MDQKVLQAISSNRRMHPSQIPLSYVSQTSLSFCVFTCSRPKASAVTNANIIHNTNTTTTFYKTVTLLPIERDVFWMMASQNTSRLVTYPRAREWVPTLPSCRMTSKESYCQVPPT